MKTIPVTCAIIYFGDKILAVRGNCEAEVDQMVLTFPVLADYAFIERDGLRIFAKSVIFFIFSVQSFQEDFRFSVPG